jgi:hypothetical protein
MTSFALSFVPLVFAAVTLIVGLRLLRLYARGRVRRRIGAKVSANELGAHEGKLVVVRGTLIGGELTTRFEAPIRAIEDVHPDAVASRPESLRLAIEGTEVELKGSAQVVLGTEERAQGGASVRRVQAGSEVLVTGIVEQSGDIGYRAVRHALAALAYGAWAERPLGVFAIERSGPLALAFAAAALGLVASAANLALGSGAVLIGPGPLSLAKPCRNEVFAHLERNAIFAAEDAAAHCTDPLAKAQAAWAVGRVDDAAKAYQAARLEDPALAYTLSEVEAIVVSQPRDVARAALEGLQKDWYRGLSDRSQRTLACLAAGGGTAFGPCSSESNLNLSAIPADFHNPVGVVTNTFHFALRLPGRGSPAEYWSDDYDRNCERAECRAAKPAVQALFAALAADSSRAAAEFAGLDRILSETPPAPPTEYGITERELTLQQAFAVAAVAAWFVHDEPRMFRYLGRAEAHTRATFEQHLKLGRDANAAPHGDQSQWSSVDRELHGLADHEAPKAFVRRLRDLRYTEPLRLLALLGARRSLHAEARSWIEGEYIPVNRHAGVFAMLAASAKRREAARIVGASELESKLTEVSRRFGEVWFRDASRELLWSLEILYAPQ